MTTRLSGARGVEHLYQAEDDTIVCVTADHDSPALFYESFKVYIGDGATMREIPVAAVARFRGSRGTIIVTSDTARLHFPAADSGTAKCGSRDLTELDPTDYDIVEAPDGTLTVTRW